ncbi:spore coat protein U domain-containing protein [Anabaena sp. CS-542/02]|uniref:spore coat protein U domain-containing protein n=1 Tax=Anabaena sp. CS-542/02 TaxID=3021719 RepID=UPI003FA47119
MTTTCTSGASATITLGQGNNPALESTDAGPMRRLSAGGSNYLQYVIFKNAERSDFLGNTDGTGVSVIC